MGWKRLGFLLELGPEGNMESNYLVCVRGDDSPEVGSGLARQASRTYFRFSGSDSSCSPSWE